MIIHTTNAMKNAWAMYEKIGFKRSEDLDFMQGNLEVFGFRYLLWRLVIRSPEMVINEWCQPQIKTPTLAETSANEIFIRHARFFFSFQCNASENNLGKFNNSREGILFAIRKGYETKDFYFS